MPTTHCGRPCEERDSAVILGNKKQAFCSPKCSASVPAPLGAGIQEEAPCVTPPLLCRQRHPHSQGPSSSLPSPGLKLMVPRGRGQVWTGGHPENGARVTDPRRGGEGGLLCAGPAGRRGRASCPPLLTGSTQQGLCYSLLGRPVSPAANTGRCSAQSSGRPSERRTEQAEGLDTAQQRHLWGPQPWPRLPIVSCTAVLTVASSLNTDDTFRKAETTFSGSDVSA